MVVRHISIAAFLAVLIIGPVLWMAFDRTPPYTFQNVEIYPTDATQGSDIYITFTVKPMRPACGPGLIYREFKEESGKLHLYDPVPRSEPPDMSNAVCTDGSHNCTKFTRISKLPDNISPGPTFYRGQACYTCNPLQSWLRWPICIQTPIVEFEVTQK